MCDRRTNYLCGLLIFQIPIPKYTGPELVHHSAPRYPSAYSFLVVSRQSVEKWDMISFTNHGRIKKEWSDRARCRGNSNVDVNIVHSMYRIILSASIMGVDNNK